MMSMLILQSRPPFCCLFGRNRKTLVPSVRYASRRLEYDHRSSVMIAEVSLSASGNEDKR